MIKSFPNMMTNAELETELEETRRSLSNVTRWGTVAEQDPAKALVRVKMGELLSAWLPVIAPASGAVRIWRFPSIDEQVIVLAPSGELASGVVLSGIYRDSFPAPSTDPAITLIQFPDGSRVVHDPANGSIYVEASQSATVKAPAITLDGPVQITGTLTVDGETSLNANTSIGGNLDVSGNINGGGSILAAGANSNHHSHP